MRKKWEYLSTSISEEDVKDVDWLMKVMGRDGWELVEIEKEVAYFKREIEEESPT